MSTQNVANHKKILIGPKKKIAFVCSGGATKAGSFHLGVALALQSHGFKFQGGTLPKGAKDRQHQPMEISCYVGTSAGSILTSYLASGYSLDSIFNSFLHLDRTSRKTKRCPEKMLSRLTYQKMLSIQPQLDLEKLTQFSELKKYFSHFITGKWGSFLKFQWPHFTGFFSTSGIEKYMREEVLPSNKFEEYIADLFIVATQLNQARKVVFGKKINTPFSSFNHAVKTEFQNHVPISDACAASVAIPIIFSPYLIKNLDGLPIHYIDGEIKDTLSTEIAVNAGADLIIASYTHQPYHVPMKGPSLVKKGVLSIFIQALYLSIEQKINTQVLFETCHKKAIEAVSAYCKEEKIAQHHQTALDQILEKELYYQKNVDTIYIHPSAEDKKIFFGDHFTLSPKKMTEIAKSGFRSANEILKNYVFSDKEPLKNTA